MPAVMENATATPKKAPGFEAVFGISAILCMRKRRAK